MSSQQEPGSEKELGKVRVTIGQYMDGKPVYKLVCWKFTLDDAFKDAGESFTGSTMFVKDFNNAMWPQREKWKKHGQCKLPGREHESPLDFKCPAWRRTRKRFMVNRQPVNNNSQESAIADGPDETPQGK